MNLYGQYCPMARALELLGDRWTLLIVRDMFCGASHFNELERGLPGISRALLSSRLRRLEQTGIVTRKTAGRQTNYQLTEAGLDLYPIVEALSRWGARWAFGEPREDELNPVLLLWWMRGSVHPERLPPQRVVIEFHFTETRPHTYWLVLTPTDVSVCVKHPGFDIDVVITTALRELYQVWLGRVEFSTALAGDAVRLDAPPNLARAFPTWFALSPTVPIVREAMQPA